MKKYIVLFLLFTAMGCTNKQTSDFKLKIKSNTFVTTFDVIVIDSCEYIKGYRSLSHKGNCNNPFHLKNND